MSFPTETEATPVSKAKPSVATESEHFVEIVSKPSEIKALELRAEQLRAANGAKNNPEFFLASLWDHWQPRVAVFKRDERVTGIVYAKERKVCGIPTGIIYVDSDMSSKVFSESDTRIEVLAEASRELLRGRRIRGLRVTLPVESPDLEGLRRYAARLGLEYEEGEATRHRLLHLPSTYDHFLENIGLKTRRHLRYYRRRSEADGHRYIEGLGVADFLRIGSELMSDGVVGTDLKMLRRAAAMVASTDDPLLVGLQAPDGAWLGALAGWLERGRAFVFLQVNSDRRHARYSPSSVLRSHLIEALIAKGVKELVFWGGMEGPLRRHSVPVANVYVYLDKPDLLWKMFRKVARLFSDTLLTWSPETGPEIG